MQMPLVDKYDDGIRPNGGPEQCFYCGQYVGQPHLPTCVIVERRVRVRYTFELEIDEPHSWSDEDIENRKNESSWCAHNAIDELDEYADRMEAIGGPCLCIGFNCEVIEGGDDTPIRKLRPPE